MGDVCHAVAMVTAIQHQRPDVEITWIIGKLEYQLLKGMQGINFVVYDKKQGKQANQQVKQALSNITFDVLFVMQVALRANLLSRVIKAKKRVGFDWHRSKEAHWLFANSRISAQKTAHVLDGFLGFAETIGVLKESPVQWEIPIEQKEQDWVAEQLKDLGEFAVISPAASKAERNWLPERYAATIDYLAKKGLSVVLCGGPGDLDKQISQSILSKTNAVSLNLVGKTNLKQMLAVLGRASLVIAPDTGPAHMATTQGTKVIGLYAHSNPRRTGPYNDLDSVVSVYDQCIQQQTGKPWQKLPWGKRAKGKDLMALIEVETVIEAIDKVLASKSDSLV